MYSKPSFSFLRLRSTFILSVIDESSFYVHCVFIFAVHSISTLANVDYSPSSMVNVMLVAYNIRVFVRSICKFQMGFIGFQDIYGYLS